MLNEIRKMNYIGNGGYERRMTSLSLLVYLNQLLRWAEHVAQLEKTNIVQISMAEIQHIE